MNNPEELQAIANQQVLMEAFDSINKGIRPPKMSMELFRFYRKMINGMNKKRLQGEMFHVSKVFNSPVKGVTYYKPEEATNG